MQRRQVPGVEFTRVAYSSGGMKGRRTLGLLSCRAGHFLMRVCFDVRVGAVTDGVGVSWRGGVGVRCSCTLPPPPPPPHSPTNHPCFFHLVVRKGSKGSIKQCDFPSIQTNEERVQGDKYINNMCKAF